LNINYGNSTELESRYCIPGNWAYGFSKLELKDQSIYRRNVAEAISGIRIIQPDVVILDIRMPGGNGIDVLQTIKQDEAAPMVIILTNYPYPGYRQKCMQAGADFFLDKSAEFDQIPGLFERFKRGARSGSAL
jgi:DNA-binding NarL/FixJ family response regulator